jgi:hypothetical protein
MTTYRVSADPRAEDQAAIDFFIDADKHKIAWTDARKLLKEGGTAKTADGDITIAAGQYTVRTVFSTERKAAKAPVLTVDALLEAAQAENVSIPKKPAELIDRLRNPATPAAA